MIAKNLPNAPSHQRLTRMYQAWQLARREGRSVAMEFDSNQLNRGQGTLC